MTALGIVTGASGLVGSEAVRYLHEQGLDVVGIDNNMRSYFFGSDGDTDWNALRLKADLARYQHFDLDIRNQDAIHALFKRLGRNVALVIHCAAQPSHDWAAREPLTDFSINALGTMILLEALRLYAPEATFIFTSTNKVYGDHPNALPLIELESRWECAADHPFASRGIDETMALDQAKHSVFGASKIAADVMCQEYGRYFGLNVGIFRGGCLTGPSHSGAELHGFLAYLIKCQLTGRPYTIFGYKGKQVRDNIHSHDLVRAFWEFHLKPRAGEVYNIGGSRHSSCSMLEAVQMVAELTGRELEFQISDKARAGDHIWWISDVEKFRKHYPLWSYQYDIKRIIAEMVEAELARQVQGRYVPASAASGHAVANEA